MAKKKTNKKAEKNTASLPQEGQYLSNARYKESEQQTKTRENNFVYHAPRAGQAERYQLLRSTAGELSKLLNEQCPPSRELSLAQTKLEEAIFWANAAIARNE